MWLEQVPPGDVARLGDTVTQAHEDLRCWFQTREEGDT